MINLIFFISFPLLLLNHNLSNNFQFSFHFRKGGQINKIENAEK